MSAIPGHRNLRFLYLAELQFLFFWFTVIVRLLKACSITQDVSLIYPKYYWDARLSADDSGHKHFCCSVTQNNIILAKKHVWLDRTCPPLRNCQSHRSTRTKHSWEDECISVCKEEKIQEKLKLMLSLLPVLMRSKSTPCAFGVLGEIIKAKLCVITKVENHITLICCILHLIQTYLDGLAISSQFRLTPLY